MCNIVGTMNWKGWEKGDDAESRSYILLPSSLYYRMSREISMDGGKFPGGLNIRQILSG